MGLVEFIVFLFSSQSILLSNICDLRDLILYIRLDILVIVKDLKWIGVFVMKVGIENKVVARFRDGKIIKGFTQDFFPNKDVFHISGTERGKDLAEVLVPDLKALFL